MPPHGFIKSLGTRGYHQIFDGWRARRYRCTRAALGFALDDRPLKMNYGYGLFTSGSAGVRIAVYTHALGFWVLCHCVRNILLLVPACLHPGHHPISKWVRIAPEIFYNHTSIFYIYASLLIHCAVIFQNRYFLFCVFDDVCARWGWICGRNLILILILVGLVECLALGHIHQQWF